MRYILPAGALTNLNFLRTQYQDERKVNLDEPPSFFGRPKLFGGTDIEARNKQTQFLIKIRAILNPNLIKEQDIETHEQWIANWKASQVMLAACEFVCSQISRPKKNSALYRLIKSDLGITGENYLDDEDKQECYFAANRIINSSLAALDDANAALHQAGLEAFSEDEWKTFSDYVTTACIKKQSTSLYANYPVTSITQPLFGAAFSYAGATIGQLGGDMISESTKALPTKLQLTAYVGSTLLLLGPAGPMGIALFSQVIAGKLIGTFCKISMDRILSVVMGLLGQAIGIGIGLPIDFVYRFVWSACAMLIAKFGNSSNTATGIRIADGKTLIGGIVIEVTPSDQIPEGVETKLVEIKEDGVVYIDGKPMEIDTKPLSAESDMLTDGAFHSAGESSATPKITNEFPPEVMAELKLQIESRISEINKEEPAVAESLSC